MNVTDIKGKDAIDVMADILEPLTTILADEEIDQLSKTGTRLQAITHALKKYPDEVIYILARLDNEQPEEYEVNLVTLPRKLLEIINAPELQFLFTSQARNNDNDSSGSVTESTEETEAE